MTNNPYYSTFFKIVEPFYNEEKRFFHNMTHLKEGLYLLQKMELQGYPITDLHYAAWCFHDAIYEFDSNENEVNSALFFEKMNEEKKLDFDSEEIETIKNMIIDTKDHNPRNKDSMIINDIDMSIIGSKYDQFLKYRKDIENEYTALYSKKFIRENSVLFFEELLNKEKIFFTDFFAEYEKRAKDNIVKYIQYIKNC